LPDKESGYSDKKGAEPQSGFRSSNFLVRHAGGKLLEGQPGPNAKRTGAKGFQSLGALCPFASAIQRRVIILCQNCFHSF